MSIFPPHFQSSPSIAYLEDSRLAIIEKNQHLDMGLVYKTERIYG